jgi:guanylate kinase
VKAKKIQNKPGKIFIISGPSGSGKTTLLTRLIQDRKIAKLLEKSRSVTTRPRRLGEKQGKDYFFISKGEFRRLLKAKKILEWTRYLGYYYGTPRELVENRLKKGKHLGLCLDLKGARILKKIYPYNSVTVFVLPPSLSVLKARIEGRCRETNKKEVTQRLRLAKREILAAAQFDYRILNQNLRVALKELKRIFLKESSV